MWASEEFSFAQISFDMINNGDYLLNEITNLKSFMTYYLTSLSMKLFGVNAFGIRFAATLSIGITAILIALLIRQLLHDKRLAALASAIYLSSVLVYFVGVYPLSDSIFTSFIFGATGTAFLAIVENSWTKRRVLMLILSGIALFAGFFTKGFLACFIWALPLVCFIILKKKWQDLLTLFYLPISIAALLVWLVGSLKYGPVYDFFNFILTIGNFNNLNFSILKV
jgi:4-amino-4-deoxy-L-arabinose transferase